MVVGGFPCAMNGKTPLKHFIATWANPRMVLQLTELTMMAIMNLTIADGQPMQSNKAIAGAR